MTWGRFLSVDPAIAVRRNMKEPQGWNRYTYAMNNPMTRVDPDGRKDTIFIINTVGGDAFNARALSALNAAVKGTRFEGHVNMIGPMATRGMLQAWVGHADKTDMVGILIHSGGTKDWKPSLGGFMMTQANLGDINKGISGTTLGNWASNGSAPGACMIGGCNSQQLAGTVSTASGTTGFGTNNAVNPGEVGMAVATTLGAMAQGKSPQEAAAAGSAQFTTPPTTAYCHGSAPGCDPSSPAQVKAVPPQ